MKITFTMSVRDEFPDFLNELARRYGQSEEYVETRPIDLMREVDWPLVPREGESVWVSGNADPRTIQDVNWDMETGEVRVALDDLDTDEIGEEGPVVEHLLDRGWQVDIEMMGWSASSE